jgi:membrane protein
MVARGVRSGLARRLGAARDAGRGLVETVPLVRRVVQDLVRIEVIDRSMAIAAQAMLALVPMLVVLVAFLPETASEIALERFHSVTGVGERGDDLVEATVSADRVRAQTGLIGLLITIFSATSFARAVQRAYERVWEQDHGGGLAGLQRCLLWLVGWLATLQLLRTIGSLVGRQAALTPVRILLQGVGAVLVWWVTMRLLLFGRVAWRALAPAAVLTGFGSVVYSWGSSLVMPAYVATSVAQFGTLGLVLAVTSWLVGFAALLVVAAVVGRAVAEDEAAARWMQAVPDSFRGARRGQSE